MPGYMPELTKHPRSESSNGFLLLLAYAVPCGSSPLKLKSFSNYAGQRSFHSLSRRVSSSLHGFKFLVFQKTIGSSIGLALSSSYCLGIRPRCQFWQNTVCQKYIINAGAYAEILTEGLPIFFFSNQQNFASENVCILFSRNSNSGDLKQLSHYLQLSGNL